MTPVEEPVLVQTFIRPFQHRVPGELLPVVGPDDVGIAAMLADAIENPHQVIGTFLRLRRLICSFCSA